MAGYGDIIDDLQSEDAQPPGAPPPNPYGQAIDDLQASQRARAAISLATAEGPPDRAAQNRALAKRYNTTPDVVDKFPEEFRQRVDLEIARQALKQAPALQQTLDADPSVAKVMHDDVANAAAIQPAVAAISPGRRGWLDSLEQTPLAAAKGIGGSYNKLASTTGLVLGAVPTIYDKAASVFTEQPETAASDWWFRHMVDPVAKVQSAFDLDQQAGFPEKAVYTVTNLLGTLSQIVLSGGGGEVAPAAASVPEVIGHTVAHGAKSMAVPAVSDAVGMGQQVYERTGDAQLAAQAAVAQYAASTAMGVVPMSAPGGVLARMGTGAASSMLSGELSRRGMNAVLPAGMQSSTSGEDVVLNALAGSILGIAGPRGENPTHDAARQTYLDAAQAEQATHDFQAMRALGDIASASKWRERDPAGFHQFVQAVTDDGHLDHVFVDAHELAGALDRSGATGAQLQDKLPDLANQMREALQAKCDVRIPVADYATHIAGGPLDETLLPLLKTDPEGKTYAEAQAFYQQQTQQMHELAAKVAEQHADNEAWKSAQKQVFDQVRAQLADTGRFSPAVSDAYAALHRDFYTVLGQRLGTTPDEAYRQHGAQIVASDIAQAKGYDQAAGDSGPGAAGGAVRSGELGKQQDLLTTVAGGRVPPGWAGATRIRAEQGPAVLFRGGNGRLDAADFQPGAAGRASGHPSSGLGVWFTTGRGEASRYGGVEQFHADIRNPAIVRADKLPAFDTVEHARQFQAELRAAGYDGLVVHAKHLGKEEVHVVAFDPHQVVRRGDFDQAAFGEPGAHNPRGQYTPASRTISLLQHADLSTFLHESGHFFLDTYAKIAASADAPPQVRADVDKLLKWFGVKDLAAWHGMSMDEQRSHHEQFARGFEQYLMEGKAPNLELAGAFGRFRSWLVRTYKSLTALNVPLTDEVRGVMDRMVASEDSIHEAQAARVFAPLFTEKPAAMSEEQWHEYQELGRQGTEEAIAQMQARSLRDMKWLSGARTRAARKLQVEAAEARRETQAAVEKEVDQQPVFRAERFLRRGEMEAPEGESNAQRKARESTLGRSTKLNLEDLKRMYGDGPAAPWRYLDTGKQGLAAKDGLHPDVVAEMFGFNSGDQLVRALLDSDRKTLVEGMTDQRMLEEHGELTDPQAIAAAADAAVHNDARARFVATGLKVLTSSPVSARQLVKGAREAADAAVAQKRVKDLNPRQYTAAESKANRAALQTVGKDPAGAAQQQRASLLNNQLAKSTTQAMADVKKGLDYLKRFGKASVRDRLPGSFLEQIDSILGQFDLRQNPPNGPTRAQQNLMAWAEGQREAGYEPQISEWLAQFGGRMHYKDLTVEQFRGMVDTVRSIEHIAKETQLVTVKGERVALDQAVDSLKARMDERGEKFTKEQLLEPPSAKTDGYWRALTHWLGTRLRLVDADLKPQEFKFNKYDLHELDGPFRQALLDPVLEANYRKVDMTRAVSEEAGRVGKELGKDWQHSLYDLVPNDRLVDPDLSKPGEPVMMKITRAKMLAIARHVGNESNFAKLTQGWNWKTGDVWQFLHDNMTEKDWQATQAHWDTFEPLWSQSEDLVRRLGGVPPPKIPAREFETKFGTLRGGYSPIDYDPIRSQLSVRKGEFDLQPGEKVGAQQVYRATTTSNGSLVARAEGYTDRVSLDFHSAEARIRDTIHDLAYREALLDATKIVDHRGFREKFQDTYGREEYQALQSWLRDIRDMNATDPRNRNFEKAMQYSRQGVVMTGIAYRLSTVVKHGSSAALKSLGYLGDADGAKFFLARVARMGSGHMVEDLNAAKEKFAEIRTRMLQMDRDYKEGNQSMYEAEDWRAKNDRFGHAMVAWSDALSAVPTAWAAYDLAKTKGVPESMGGTGKPMPEEDAVRYANSIVRQAHGSALEVTRSNFMQSRGVKGLFGTIYGFMNNTYGQLGDMLDKAVKGGHWDNKPAIAARAMATLVMPAVVAQWVKGNGGDDKEPWYAWGAKAITGELAATVPFVRDAWSMIEYGRTDDAVAPIRLIADAYKAGHDVLNIAEGKSQKIIQDLANAIGEWAHIGGLGQAGKTAQYLEDVRTGKQHPKGAAELVKGATIGGAAPRK